MPGATAAGGPGQAARRYSAKAEIDDFMRRFLAYAKTDNAAARATPKVTLRDGSLTSDHLKAALDRLDLLCARLDIETTNAIQVEIQNEALQSLHQDRTRRHADEIRALEAGRRAAETLCETLERRLKVAEALGAIGRFSPAKTNRLVGRDRRRMGRRVRVASGAADGAGPLQADAEPKG